MQVNTQDLTWLYIALKQYKSTNVEILAKCNTFEGTLKKVEQALLTEGIRNTTNE